MKLTSNEIDVGFFVTHGFLDGSISKMYEGTRYHMMTFKFWKFLFGLHRKSDESPDKKNTTHIIIIMIIIIMYLCL